MAAPEPKDIDRRLTLDAEGAHPLDRRLEVVDQPLGQLRVSVGDRLAQHLE